MRLFDLFKKKSKKSILRPVDSPKNIKKDTSIEKHKVTGTSHYINNILKFKIENSYYSDTKKELIEEGLENEKIFEYEFYPDKIELIPEPENPYDPNAIKVVADSLLVGYIKAGSCAHIHNLLKNDRIVKIDYEMGGGNYKYLDCDEDEKYTLEDGNSPYFVDLFITVKNEQ